MRLTIDTKADSKDEIRKVIKLLMGLVGAGHEVYGTQAPQSKQETPSVLESQPSQVSNLMSIFDAPQQQEAPAPVPEQEQDADIPTIEFY